MLTIQLKVERETDNPIKPMKLIDFSLKINTSLRLPPRGLDQLSPEVKNALSPLKLDFTLTLK